MERWEILFSFLAWTTMHFLSFRMGSAQTCFKILERRKLKLMAASINLSRWSGRWNFNLRFRSWRLSSPNSVSVNASRNTSATWARVYFWGAESISDTIFDVRDNHEDARHWEEEYGARGEMHTQRSAMPDQPQWTCWCFETILESNPNTW